ncbi:hypothetical protein [Aurantiacibacter spongiae]|nr:hypothetical protein [Aurantiacibacter spongiae]
MTRRYLSTLYRFAGRFIATGMSRRQRLSVMMDTVANDNFGGVA